MQALRAFLEALVESYRHKPLQGLLQLNKENYKGIGLLRTLDKAEEDISPAPSGRAKRLMLFFYLIDILQSNGAPFYVKGGLVLQYYLEDHARPANDLDILIPPDVDAFYRQAEEAFRNNAYGLDISIARFSKEEADENFCFPTFAMLVSISMEGRKIDEISLEGISGDLFYELSPKEYEGPSIVKERFTFLGVPLEHAFADKIHAITSELNRPYKHLIDAYSISQVEVDICALKKYLAAILSYENAAREKLGMQVGGYQFEIKPGKQFSHGYLFPLIQAGLTLDAEEMIQRMNQYMSTHLY